MTTRELAALLDRLRAETTQGAITHAALLLLGREETTTLLAPAAARISWIPPPAEASGLVEGRYPNLVVSAEVAAVSGEKAKYVRDSGFDGQYYRDLVVKLVRKHQPVSREDIDQLFLDKLPEILSREQKLNRIHNLLRQLTTGGRIHNEGSRRFPKWVLASDENNQ